MERKPRHIIIDGCDNLGKSTVIKIISEKLNLPVVKMPNMKEYIEQNNPEEFSKLFNETIIQFARSSFILDRGFTSSIVYSRVFNRKFNLSYLKKIEEVLQPKIIILTGRSVVDGKVIYSSFSKDKVFDEEQKKQIDKAFCNLAYRNNYPLIEVLGKTPEEIAKEILLCLK